MAYTCLVEIQPLNTGTGLRVPVRVTDANDRRVTGLNGVVWEPALVSSPVLQISLWNGDFVASVETGNCSLGIAMDTVKNTVSNVDELVFSGAPVTIYAEEIGTAWPWTERFTGKIRDFSRTGQTVTLTCSVDSEPFEADLLPTTYAGTTGAEGPADLKGRRKPLVIGWASGVEPILIDATNSVYQFSGYGAIEAVTALFERGSDFGPAAADYASYASLVAATVPAGTWATCLAQGMIRLGAPAYGVITGDVKGHVVSGSTPRLTGAVIKAMATVAGISHSLLDTASLDAMDTAVPYPINVVFNDQTSFADAASALALAALHQAGVGFDGKFFVTGPDLTDAAALTLDGQGRTWPQVIKSDEVGTSPPYWRIALGAKRCWRVHGTDEIAYYAPLIDMGAWDVTVTYREGNIVTDVDGNRWIYVNPVPTAGNVPQDGSSYWEPLSSSGTGIITDRSPNAVPTSPPVGSIYFDSLNYPYRFEGYALTWGTDPLLYGSDPINGPGWVSVRDKTLADALISLQQVDDDGIITTDEKIRILIPDSARLEATYQSLITQATAAGIPLLDLTEARANWLAMRNSLVPAWNDTTQTSPVVRADWDSILETYRTALADAEAIIRAGGLVTVIPPPAQFVEVDADGDPLAGQYSRVLTPVVKRGSTDIRDDNDVSYSITTSGITATVNNTNGSADKGKITATAGASGSIELTVNVGGTPYGPYTITFTSKYAQAFTGNGTSGKKVFEDGFVITWKTVTVAANGTTTSGYGDSHTFTTFAKAWFEGGTVGANAQDNNPFVNTNDLDSADIYSARDQSITGVLFAFGI